ncbi:hypothetical protein EJ110_NYTH11131 [Nymphaea thermarum]|nr:hypothetical protein EJ110_NYTH11131 [Nymphaea thermarum]
MSIMEYLGRLKGIADQLGVAGYVVSDKEKVQQTLSGLGPDFYVFTTALEVLPILPTFNELQGKLLQHEMNMKQLMRGTNQGNAHNVLVMEVAAGHRKGNGAHQGGMKRGHDEQTGKGILPTPSVTRRFQTNTTKKVPTCFQCNKEGRIKANCWFNPQNRSNKPEVDAQQILMTALSKMTVKQNDQGEWYLDSGAATHVTGNADLSKQPRGSFFLNVGIRSSEQVAGTRTEDRPEQKRPWQHQTLGGGTDPPAAQGKTEAESSHGGRDDEKQLRRRCQAEVQTETSNDGR